MNHARNIPARFQPTLADVLGVNSAAKKAAEKAAKKAAAAAAAKAKKEAAAAAAAAKKKVAAAKKAKASGKVAPEPEWLPGEREANTAEQIRLMTDPRALRLQNYRGAREIAMRQPMDRVRQRMGAMLDAISIRRSEREAPLPVESEPDVPEIAHPPRPLQSLKAGGLVKKTGIIKAHQGEVVVPKSRVASVVRAVKKAGLKPLKM